MVMQYKMIQLDVFFKVCGGNEFIRNRDRKSEKAYNRD